MSMTKAEKAEMDALRRQVRELEAANSVLRGTVQIKNAVGKVLLEGYGSEPLPLGEYFRLSITDYGSQSNGLDVCMSDGLLAIYVTDGIPLAVPSSSNVMRFVRGRQFDRGIVLAKEPAT